MNCKISVIIPIYNVEKYLRQCLDSVINQTWQDLEIICVNDGSTDASKSIVDEYIARDSRVIAVNKTNAGYGAACNAGLRLASGKYIAIVEPDDFLDKNMFWDLYSLAEKYNTDIVKSPYYELTDANEQSDEKISKINWSVQYNMPEKVFKLKDCAQLFYFHPSIWSCLYRKDFLDKHNIRFVEAKGAGWVDNPFQVQTLCLANRIFYTDNAYYYYRLTNPSSSSNIVNLNNPFERTEEVHAFLKKRNIKDNNLLAHLYKRELSYINTVLSGITADIFDNACVKIIKMVTNMDKNIIYKNKYITDYEKMVWHECRSPKGIAELAINISNNPENVEVVDFEAQLKD